MVEKKVKNYASESTTNYIIIPCYIKIQVHPQTNKKKKLTTYRIIKVRFQLTFFSVISYTIYEIKKYYTKIQVHSQEIRRNN